jgi:hypothetical protein
VATGNAARHSRTQLRLSIVHNLPAPKGRKHIIPGQRQGEFCEPCHSPGLQRHKNTP